MLTDVIDTYYEYVKANMLANVDAGQLFGGFIMARDWPMTPSLEDALYLLFMDAVPVEGGTEGQVKYEFLCQWSWLVIGANIAQTERKENRADRYRKAMKIMANLRQANFPGFTQKNTAYAADPQTGAITSTPATSTVPMSPRESIYWTRLRLAPRQDNDKSGLIYGAATVRIYAWDDVLATLPQAVSF